MDKGFLKAVLVLAVMGLSACSSEPAKTTETKTDAPVKAPAGPPEPVAGKTAFYEMYTPAHTWAADLLPVELEERRGRRGEECGWQSRLPGLPFLFHRRNTLPARTLMPLPISCPTLRKA